jgi:surfactin synthase thioesterase subunit
MRTLAFVFSGQGAHWPRMAMGLFDRDPVVADELRRCDRAIQARLGWSVLEVLRDPTGHGLERQDIVQPATFAVQVALTAWWRSVGVVPDMVMGHSLGEVAAALAAGHLSFDAAMQVICERSLAAARPEARGATAFVELPRAELATELEAMGSSLSIAAVNGGRSTVVSGTPQEVERLLERLTCRGVFCNRVAMDLAAHSAQLDVLLPELRTALRGLSVEQGVLPFYSTVSGARWQGPLDAEYWVANFRQTILFGAALTAMLDDGATTFVEVSAHPVLVPTIAAEVGDRALVLPSLLRRDDERRALLRTTARLYVGGHAIDWTRLGVVGRADVELPLYPWQHRPYWRKGGESHADIDHAPAGMAPRSQPLEAPRDLSSMLDFLRGLFASAMGEDPARFEPELPIEIDSLLAMELCSQLSRTLGKPVAVSWLLQRPNLRELAERCLGAGQATPLLPTQAESPPAWRRWIGATSSTRQRLRLLCLPPAGGLAMAFGPWRGAVGDRVEVCPVEYPGHGGRRDEALVESIVALVAAMRAELQDVLAEPLALFGHSMGALVAFELAKTLERDGMAPVALFLSAPPAHGPSSGKTEALAQLPDSELVRVLRRERMLPEHILGDADLLAYLLPTIRHDLSLTAGYRRDGRLSSRGACWLMGAENDSVVGPSELDSWLAHLPTSTTRRLFAGDHLYALASGTLVTDFLRHALAELPEVTP